MAFVDRTDCPSCGGKAIRPGRTQNVFGGVGCIALAFIIPSAIVSNSGSLSIIHILLSMGLLGIGILGLVKKEGKFKCRKCKMKFDLSEAT